MTMKMAILPGRGKDESSPSSACSKSSYNSSINNSSKGSVTPTRPRAPALWSVNDCKLWLGRHCGDLGVHYSELFHQNNINGRSLLRLNSMALERMGITNPAHKEEIWREVIKLKLKSDVLELRDLENQLTTYNK